MLKCINRISNQFELMKKMFALPSIQIKGCKKVIGEL